MELWRVRGTDSRANPGDRAGVVDLSGWVPGWRDTSARRRESGPGDRTVTRCPRRYCAVCARTCAARVRGALDRVVPRRRSTLSAEYGHALRAELLPRNTGYTDLERTSPRLDRSEGGSAR